MQKNTVVGSLGSEALHLRNFNEKAVKTEPIVK
jgi:hypothetical protein